MSFIHLVSLTKDALKQASKYLDVDTVKRAWIQTKLNYIKSRGAHVRSDLLTYKRIWFRRFYVHNYLRAMLG